MVRARSSPLLSTGERVELIRDADPDQGLRGPPLLLDPGRPIPKGQKSF